MEVIIEMEREEGGGRINTARQINIKTQCNNNVLDYRSSGKVGSVLETFLVASFGS